MVEESWTALSSCDVLKCLWGVVSEGLSSSQLGGAQRQGRRPASIPRDRLPGLLDGNTLHRDGKGSCLQTVMTSQPVNQFVLCAGRREGALLTLLTKILQIPWHVRRLVGRINGSW